MDATPDAIGTSILLRLASENLPATPENYSRRYFELTGETASPRITAEGLAPCAEMLGLVRGMVGGVASTTDALANVLGEQNARLADDLTSLKQSSEREEILRLLHLIIAHTERIQDGVEISQRELTEARHALEQMQAELIEARQQLNEDPLTGALNRRGLDQTLAREVARTQRNKGKLCLAMLDLDYFKRVNDNYGHEVGDQLLVHFAAQARSVLRKSDALIRYGGEEFTMLLPDTDMPGARHVLSRLQMLASKSPMTSQGKPIKLTFSAGIATLRAQENGHSLLHRADEALYAAKLAGRNCIKLAE
jgi:diguanylate cyclase